MDESFFSPFFHAANWNEIGEGGKFYVRQEDWREKSSGQKASSFQVFSQSEETEWGVCIWGISNHRSQAKLSSSSTFVIRLGGKKSFAKYNTAK